MGTPESQGSKVARAHGGKAWVVEGSSAKSARHKDWRQAVRAEAQRWVEAERGRGVIAGPVDVSVTFFLRRPPSKPKWRSLPWEKPDGDKLVRAVLDSLSGVVIEDDARAVDIHVYKRWPAPGQPTGCDIVVRALDERAGCW